MSAVQDFIAGWVAGVAALTVGHPFDTIKVRQQVLNVKLLPAVHHTWKNEGLRGFYKGYLFPCLIIGPSNSIYFGIYSMYMNMIGRSGGKESRLNLDYAGWKMDVFTGGVIGGIVQVLITCPMEVVKTTMQMQTRLKGHGGETHVMFSCVGLFECCRKLFAKRKLWIYRGLTAMMLRDCPTSGLYILVYESLVSRTYGNDLLDHRLFKQPFAGGLAGVVSWAIVIPFDVIKSRMQADNVDKPVYRNTWLAAMDVYHSHGLNFFFRGGWPLIMRSFPFNAVVFVTYESLMAFFRRVF